MVRDTPLLLLHGVHAALRPPKSTQSSGCVVLTLAFVSSSCCCCPTPRRHKWLFLRAAGAHFDWPHNGTRMPDNMVLTYRDPKDATNNSSLPRVYVPNVPDSYAEYDQELQSPRYPRIMVTRNPYARLLSAYLDKCIHQAHKMPSHFPEMSDYNWTATPEDFVVFVDRLHALLNRYRATGHEAFNAHFWPISEKAPGWLGCGVPHGFQYDYVLKLEEEGTWFAEMLALTGMSEVAAWGWGRGERFELMVRKSLLHHPAAWHGMASQPHPPALDPYLGP